MKHRCVFPFTALVGMTLLLFSGCSDPCANTDLDEATSPDGKYVTTAFIRDCGATTDFSPQVELRLVGQSRGKTGNVYIGDHSDEIKIAWLSATQLVIYSDASTVKQMTNFHGILIEKKPMKH
jgi:hypothetical protein